MFREQSADPALGRKKGLDGVLALLLICFYWILRYTKRRRDRQVFSLLDPGSRIQELLPGLRHRYRVPRLWGVL